MAHRYEHIISPLPIGNGGKVLKSRLYLAKCQVQNDPDFYIRCAANGAAIVTIGVGTYEGRSLAKHPRPMLNPENMLDPEVREKYRRQNEALHALGTLASASMMDIEPDSDWAISDCPNWDEIPRTGDYRLDKNLPGIPEDILEKMIQEFVFRASDCYSLGFDMVCFYVSYRASILANSLSPCYNQRTDRYGGPTNAHRAALCKEVFRRIKAACPELLIEVQISGEEEAPGYTTADLIDYAREWAGLVDLYQVRGHDGSSTHVCGYNMAPHCPPNLKFAEAMKKAGVPALVAPVGGFGEPDDVERFLAEGKMDLAAVARMFIAEPEYWKKLNEERGEDVVPCLLCNGCHGMHRCAVNPQLLTRDRVYPETPARKKKVAVIGGGISGIQAARTAAGRGHQVVLFERRAALGGQLKFADFYPEKWPVRDYRDFEIRQLEKSGVEIRLNHEATPEEIRAEGFDAVICALGSVPNLPPIPGADAPFVWQAEDVYGHEQELGPRVVVIGGGTTGRETAVHLAKCGHKTTLVARKQVVLFEDPHSQRAVEDAALTNPNFSYLDHAATREIGDGYVVCEVKRGAPRYPLGFNGYMFQGYIKQVEGENRPNIPECPPDSYTLETVRLEFDSVVVSAGRRSLTDLSESFRGAAPEFYVVGDNAAPGDIKKCNTEAYDAAMRL